mgnify:CR=1 FL=1
MGMGPLAESRPWNTRNVVGSMRFLQRLWRNVIDETTGEVRVTDGELDTKTLKLIMNDHAYAQVYSVIKMQQAEGLQMDKHILDIKEVQLQVGAEGCGEV